MTWLAEIEGTEAGQKLALVLALNAAFLHAIFGALQKGEQNPWLVRGAIDVFVFLFALPIAFFVVPWPRGSEWGLLLGAFVIHFFYKYGMAKAYELGAYTVVYPIVRGMGPLFTVLGAYVVFDERFTGVQWIGVAVLLAGIFGLAIYNFAKLEEGRETLIPALLFAVATGALVALYTTWDAYGMRATPNPFTFLFWFFLLDGLNFIWLSRLKYKVLVTKPPLAPLMKRGALGALIAFGSFGSVMMATRLDKVGEAAILRETSTVFAALIGWLILKETVGPRRLALMALIAGGAVIVEMGG
ncbi:MAG: DMT family transporter [Pseudomonadota bacterium]